MALQGSLIQPPHTITYEEEMSLKNALRKGVVMFKYFSDKDQDERVAYGTLLASVIDAVVSKNSAAANSKHSESRTAISYFDLEKRAFRSFKKENYIGMMQYGTTS